MRTVKRHHTGPIPPKGQRTTDRAHELYAAGKTVEEVAAELGVCRKSALDYRARCQRATGPAGPHRGQRYDAGHGHCSCGLRLFGDEEIPGQCNGCLPASAVDYLGRRGAPYAHAQLVKSFGGC